MNYTCQGVVEKMYGERLKTLRKERKDFTKKTWQNIWISVFGDISSTRAKINEPNIKMLTKLADFYDVSIDYLVGRTDIPK